MDLPDEKDQVDELFIALKSIPISDYMELSFLLEDEFRVDSSCLSLKD